MERRGFTGPKAKLSLGDYPEAVRQLAKEDNVAMIDLHAMSVQFYESLGPDKAYLAFAGNGDKRDATHHNKYGAYELAKCIVNGIKANDLDLAKSIVDDYVDFDPSYPDNVDSFMMATGPSRVSTVPLGKWRAWRRAFAIDASRDPSESTDRFHSKGPIVCRSPPFVILGAEWHNTTRLSKLSSSRH